MEQNK